MIPDRPLPPEPKPALSAFRSPFDHVRHAGLLAGMLALLVQMVAWGAGLPANAAASRGGGSGDAVVICTVEGLKRIVVDADGQVLPGDGGAGERTDRSGPAGGHCPLCPIVGGAGLPPQTIAVSLPNPVGSTLFPGLADDAVVGGRICSGWQARAPPRIL